MMSKLAQGQKVRFNKRCVLSACVPKNSNGYTHAVLVPKEGDAYVGAGVIEPGTDAIVVEYAAHATGTTDVPIVRVRGVLARCHPAHLDAA